MFTYDAYGIGSSSMNAMMITEGAPSDYDEWVRLGAKGWGYDNIKRYFLKTQGHALHKAHPNTTHQNHGSTGRVQTGYSYCGVSPRPSFLLPASQCIQAIAKDFLRACEKNGIEYNP